MTPPPVTISGGPPGCVRATLSSPAFSEETVTALSAALAHAEGEPGVRAFAICSAGPAFCTGMPLTGSRGTDDVLRGVRLARDLLADLSRSPLVTVALVNGKVTGGGVALAAACDQVIAAPSASFRITELLVGLLPAILLPVVARRTGLDRAFTLALTAQELTAEAAVAAGLADRTADDLETELRALLRGLRRTDPAAVAALKRYRTALEEPGPVPAELATSALRERLEDPATGARIQLLAEQGLLP